MTMAKKKSKFRRRLPLVGIFLLLITGICFFAYPILSNFLTEHSAQAVIKQYDEQVQKIGDDAVKKLAEDAEEYNKALAKNQGDKISVLSYKEMLSVTDSIGYIEIPKIGAYYPIYHGLSDDMLQKGIGHMEGTSLPIGGESTHSVLAGHTGLPGSKLFTDIDTLEDGDVFYIHVLDRVLKYRVDQIKTVLPNQIEDIVIAEGEDHVTLVTCTPYGINDHRLLVRGTRAAYVKKESSEVISIKNEKQVSDPEVSEAGVHEARTLDEEKQVLPARTIIWYITTGVIAVVIIGILAILLFPTLRKNKGGESGNKVNAGEETADLED